MRPRTKDLGPYIYSERRASWKAVAGIAALSIVAGVGADSVYHAVRPGPFDASSIEATNVTTHSAGGEPNSVDMTVRVQTLGQVSIASMRQEVLDRLTAGRLIGYHEPDGFHLYRPECFVSSSITPESLATFGQIACSSMLWPNKGPQPADN